MQRDTELALKLFIVLHRASDAIEAHAAADVERHGLSLAEFEALEALYHLGDLLVGELQRKVLKSSGGITYVLDRLEDKGLVTRKPCTSDRRATYASIRAKGRRLMDRIFPIHAAALSAAMAELSTEEKRTAIELVGRVGRGAARAALPEAAKGKKAG